MEKKPTYKERFEEIRGYIRDELVSERLKMERVEPNHYCYLFMIANDLALIDPLSEG